MEFELTKEMREAMDIINNTKQSLYITGKAGTGKTTFLKYIIKHTNKNIVVAAPTGVAAVNAGGTTLHSLLSIPFGIAIHGSKGQRRLSRERMSVIKRMDILVIDEISMVRADVMDFVNARLCEVRSNGKPFGGVQLVMFGDLYQLPPVVKKEEDAILKRFYKAPYFFNANIFDRCEFRIIELTKIFRQTDEHFIQLLNHLRAYQITNADLERLKMICNVRECNDFNSNRVHICSLRSEVQAINEGQLGEPTHVFSAFITGDFLESNAPCDVDLKLRVGARVMMLKNDSEERKYYNGSLGTVTAITDSIISVSLDNGLHTEVGRHAWKTYEYEVNDEDKIVAKEKGSLEQFPIALAWAVTIHKSQGLTFDRVAIHANRIFAPGQIYVALSRCTSLEGIVTDTFIGRRHVLPNRELVAFEEAYKDNGYIFDDRTKEIAERDFA